MKKVALDDEVVLDGKTESSTCIKIAEISNCTWHGIIVMEKDLFLSGS